MYKDTCNKVKDKNRFQFFNRIGINEDDIKNYEMAHRTEHMDWRIANMIHEDKFQM